MLIVLVLFYGTDSWTLLSTDAAALRVFEEKLYLRSSVECELAMISSFDLTLTCMNFTTTRMLYRTFTLSQLGRSMENERRTFYQEI